MPRPKGTFKTPAQIAALSPERRERYLAGTKDYRKNYKRRDANARKIPSYVERRQSEADAKVIDWDAFPLSGLREWMRTHCPDIGASRRQAARWETTNSGLSMFLSGRRRATLTMLMHIAIDTTLSIESLIHEFNERNVEAEKKEKNETP